LLVRLPPLPPLEIGSQIDRAARNHVRDRPEGEVGWLQDQIFLGRIELLKD
jgi:hypothetical protein